MSVPGIPHLPSSGRMLLLAVAVASCFILGTDGAWAQTGDDHGNTDNTATPLPLDSSANGRINYGSDLDLFKLDLSTSSGNTDVWIYTTGALDTWGGLYDSNGALLVSNDNSLIADRWTNFHLRVNLPRGVYYVGVFSRDQTTTGDYTLHARTVTDPGNSTGTATTLALDSPTPGTIDTPSDADYFRLELTEFKNLILYARSVYVYPDPIDGDVLDSGGAEIPQNVSPLYYPYPIELPDGSVIPGNRIAQGFRIRDDFEPGTYYIKVTTPADATSHPVPYTIHVFEDTAYTTSVNYCATETVSLNNPQINDSWYGCQWHLNNRRGEDINVEAVWEEGITGEGVNVVVVDDGMDHYHEDLANNIDTSRNHDYTDVGDIHRPFAHHGTGVAGVIAARDNGIGVRGVASRSTIYGYNVLVDRTAANESDAMARNRDVTAVSNNSWGPPDGPGLDQANSLWELGVNSGVTTGYGGKGVFYAWAGGNGHEGGDNSNFDEYANYYAVTAVCAVNDQDTRSSYSEKGANLWVCAPSNDPTREGRGIVTTENSDRYRYEFGGTSSATPMVSGVAALLRHSNPDLTWRDLKLILAASARKNDPVNSGWEEGAHKYMVNAETDRYHFNHEYGFGTVDAKAAVDLARGWTTVPPLLSSVVESGGPTVPIPDAPVTGSPTMVTSTLTMDTGIRFTEFVEIKADFRHLSFRDLAVELVSPSGAISKLAVPFDTFAGDVPLLVVLDGAFHFGSARHLGEDPNGQWTLRVTDHLPGIGGTLRSWSIKVYGHGSRPDPPSITTPITAGADSMTVAWSAPDDDGGSPITAYDLRYIRTEDDETLDANWTVMEGVWTTGSGSLQYVITGLTGGTQYDVQMRAVSSGGAGPWSATAIGTTAPPVIPGVPQHLTAGVAVDEARVDLSWTAPISSGGAPITGYKIESSYDGGDPWVEVYTTTGAATSYADVGADANGPTFGVGVMRHYRVSAINSVGTGPPSNVAIATPDACRDPLGLLTAPVTRMAAWADDCASEGRPGSYARYYSFTLNQAGPVEMNLTSATDPYLVLRQGEGRDGSVVVDNDNVGSRNFNSSINRVLDAGTYTVEATTYFARQTGDFTLSVRPLQETEDLGPLTRSVDRSNSMWVSDYESTQPGRGYARSYTFTLNAATNVVINLTSPQDPYLYVLRNGAVAHENDNVTTRNLNSRVDTTLQPGTYTIEATTYFPAQTGTFHLSIGYFGISQ